MKKLTQEQIVACWLTGDEFASVRRFNQYDNNRRTQKAISYVNVPISYSKRKACESWDFMIKMDASVKKVLDMPIREWPQELLLEAAKEIQMVAKDVESSRTNASKN